MRRISMAAALAGALFAAGALEAARADGDASEDFLGVAWAEGDRVFWRVWGPNEPAVVLRVKPRFGEVLIRSLDTGDTNWVRASDLVETDLESLDDDAAELDLLLNGADAYCALTGNCP